MLASVCLHSQRTANGFKHQHKYEPHAHAWFAFLHTELVLSFYHVQPVVSTEFLNRVAAAAHPAEQLISSSSHASRAIFLVSILQIRINYFLVLV